METKQTGCWAFTFQLCDEVAQIVLREQTNSLIMGKHRGRNQIINRIVREWDQMKRDLNSSGTDASDTGNI